MACALAAAAGVACAQDIVVGFRFDDPDITKVEDHPEEIEKLVARELVEVLAQNFPYWGFRTGAGQPSEYRMAVSTSCCRAGSDRDLTVQLVYPPRLEGKTKSWTSTLFPFGERAIYSGDRKTNPSGRAWTRAIREQFLKIMMPEHRDDIMKELHQVPVGENMKLLGTTDQGRRTQIPALLTPRRKETASLEDALFILIYRNDVREFYLEAVKPRSLLPPAPNAMAPLPFRAQVRKVVRPEGTPLKELDGLNLASDCFLLTGVARFNLSLQAPR